MLGDLVDGEVPTENPAEYPEESAIVESVQDHFEGLGYTTDHDGNRVVDIIAQKDDKLWAIEVKGYDSGLRTKITSALGQVVYPLELDDIKRTDRHPAIAFPRDITARKDFRERIDQHLSKEILELLSITVIFVDESGVEIHEPGEIGYES